MAGQSDPETISGKIRTCMEEYAEREMDVALNQSDAGHPVMCWTRATSAISYMKQAAAAARGENAISTPECAADLFSEGTPPPSQLFDEPVPMQGVDPPVLSPSGGIGDCAGAEEECKKTVRLDEESGEVTITTKVSIGPKNRKKSGRRGKKGAKVHHKLAEPDDDSVPVVTLGLLSHLSYCRANNVSKEKVLEHSAKTYDYFNSLLPEGESWIERLEEMLGPEEFERQARTTPREILVNAIGKYY